MARQKKIRAGRLTYQRVIDAALRLADSGGVQSLSMRKLAAGLGVEAMSLYHHVANKDAILDGIVDAVFAEIELPDASHPWMEAMHRRGTSARDALLKHPWAVGLMDSRRNAGAATLTHHDSLIGCLLAGGFTIAQAARALSVIDSYIYGFVIQETALPFKDGAELAEVSEAMMAAMPANAYPNLIRMMTEHALLPGYDYADEFEHGLALILDGLQRLLFSGASQ